MKTPIDLAKKFIFIPLENLPEKFLKKVNISKILKNASDAAFEISKDTALVMLFCDAISILSSHNEQIKGLKKSNKDSKETLIELERIERNLDLALTIVPPTLLNRAIKKKLESFQVTTKKAEDLMFNYIGPGVGAHKTELKSTEYMRPLTEKAIRAVAKFTGAISNNKKLNPKTQEQFSKISNFCKSKIPDLNNMYIPRSIEEVTSYFDDMSHRVSPTIKSKLRNASAYDEIQGMVNGLCVASVIAYSILVSNVLMPILKPKFIVLNDRIGASSLLNSTFLITSVYWLFASSKSFLSNAASFSS